ncbi:MAG: phytoene dehydrogenase [Methylophilaceae bacterium 17-44-8]|jgi:phytoene desaturase|nr:MAG: phytoene dehydrogenase [Methylophilaceae bacterium 17-44-8]
MKRALVIGGGFGGMAAALRLRAKNYDVTIVDRAPMLGGRGQVFIRNGYKHDAGPTVITAPFLLEELFALFNEKLSDHITFVPLKPWYRFYFADKTTFDYGGTLEETLTEIEKISPGDVSGYRRLLKHSQRIFDIAFVQLSSVPFNHFFKMISLIPKLVLLRSYETVWQMVCRFLKHEKLRQAFSIQPLLVGGNPFSTTSIYGLIHYLERAYGVFFAMGGTGAIVNALSDLMKRQGIHIVLNTTVTKIDIENNQAKRVILSDGTTQEVDLIVSNADPTYLYQNMVETHQTATSTKFKLKVAHYSMGLFVVYFGSTKKYEDVAHHTIWLGKTYKKLLHNIFDKKILSDDFSLYLHRPTATDTSFAPEGCDSFYVLCPVPNLQGNVNWETEGELLKNRIIDALDQTILPDLKQHIVEDFFMSPVDFKQNYLSTHGAGFSIAPIFRQSAWFRFHNQSEKIKNLYIVGAGTHPGAGLPGVLCSAKVVDSMLPMATE